MTDDIPTLQQATTFGTRKILRRPAVVVSVVVLVGIAIVASTLRQLTATPPTRLGPGVQSSQMEFEGSPYSVFTVQPAAASIELVWKQEDGRAIGTLASADEMLRQRGKSVVFATNAGIFSRERKPLGLHTENGTVLSPLNRDDGVGNFYLKPGGVFWTDVAGSHIATTDVFVSTSPKSPPIRVAAQSGPMLVIDGTLHPGFDAHSTNVQIRSGVGIRRDGGVSFLLSKEPVTFDAFARCFRDGLQCPNALYLDGAISAFRIAGVESPPQTEPFAGMFVVATPAPSPASFRSK